MRSLSVLLILGLFIGTVICGCSYTNGHGQYSGGCIQNCKDYSTVSAAMDACDLINNCGGVTYSYKSIGGSGATNAIGNGWGYQLRAGFTGAKSPNKENSWLKSVCPNPNTPFDPCDFKEGQGTYLSGCIQNCKDFSNLNDALAACRTDASCGGVTFSRKDIGGSAATNAFDGVWGFQLRAGTQLISTPNGENSWAKSTCPTSNINGSYCAYSKQSYRTFANQLNGAAYNDEASALAACDSRSDCTGVLSKSGQFFLSSGVSSASSSNTVAYTRGTCNVVGYPILFTGCNFTGEKLELKQSVEKVELKNYKSLYVPAGQFAKFWSKEKFQGNGVENKSSIYCQEAGFSVLLQLSKGFGTKTSIEVGKYISNKAYKKLKANN